MFAIFKAVANNLNQIPYRKNINGVQLKTSEPIRVDAKNLVPAKKYSLDGLNKLETKVRKKNLKVFLTSYLVLRSARFIYISLPAMLTVGTIAYCFTPNTYNVYKDVETFRGEHKLYHSLKGVVEYEDKYVYLTLSESIIETDESELEEKIEAIDYLKDDELVFKIYDELNSFLAKFSFNSNGQLTLNDYVVGDVIDFNEYGKYEFGPTNEDYDFLVTKIINILISSGVLTKEETDILMNLSESDKKVIVTEIHKYTQLENQRMLISKARYFAKSMWICATMVYYFALIMGLSQKKHHYLECKGYKIKNENGELSFDKDSKEIYYGLIYGPLAIREHFLKAEYDRIMRIKNEIEEHTNPYANSILTKYERSLKPRNFER